MKTLSLYLKLVQRSALGNFFMYTGIFLFIMIVSTSTTPASSLSFEISKANVAIIDRDDSEFTREFTEYICENASRVELEDESEKLNDALFFGDASVILIIPDGFGESFLNGGDMKIETMESSDAVKAALVKQLMNNYLTASSLYLSANSAIDYDAVKTHVSTSADIEITSGTEEKPSSNIVRFMNMLAYPFLGIFTACVVQIMMTLNKLETRRRTLCAPIKRNKYTLKIYVGNVLFALVVYAVFMIAAFAMLGSQLLTTAGLLMMLNAFALAMVSLSLSFLLGTIISNRAVLSGVSNVLSLGFCFLGGAFVEQQYLTETVKSISVINPVYWFVNVNETIMSLSEINMETIQPAIGPFLIQLCFIPIFVIIALIITKQKSTSAS